MPLYLVRWPGLVAALVKARDEDELLDILDETANPEGCTWSIFNGPICIEFALNAESEVDGAEAPRDRPLQPEQIRIGDVRRICEHDVMSAYIPENSETAHRMVSAITRKAFPALHAVNQTDVEFLSEPAVRGALLEDLDALVRASWQHQQTKRRDDSVSRTAAMMGTSPRLVAYWTKRALEAEEQRKLSAESTRPIRKPAVPKRTATPKRSRSPGPPKPAGGQPRTRKRKKPK